MSLRRVITVLWFVAFVPTLLAGASPPLPLAGDDCSDCPAASGAGGTCDEGCALCVCGAHRVPMIAEAPETPVPASGVTGVGGALHPAHPDPAPHDILHVPRPRPA